MLQLQTAPVAQKERIEIIDIIRGVALLGILMMNIPFFSNPSQYEENPTLTNFEGANYYTWWTVNTVFEGTMRGLFTILFGAGSILLISRLEKKNPGMAADIYYRRLLWLLLFGMINAFIFLWPGDILYSYAICGLLIFPFRNMKARHLFMISAFLLVLTSAKDTWKLSERRSVREEGEKALALEASNKKLSPEQEEAKATWISTKERMDPEKIKQEAAEETKKMQQGYFGVFKHLRTVNVWIQTTLFYSNYFLDIMLLLFLGMGLLKTGVLTAAKSKKFYWAVLLIGYTVGLITSYFFTNAKISSGFDSTRALDYMPFDLYQVKRLFLSLGHLSFFMLLYKYNIAGFLMHCLKRVGQMAFSNYLMQSLICTIIFYGYGFRMFGKLQIHQEYYVMAAVWILQIIFSVLWLRYFRFGPFEWAWRSLTYWKLQPMKRNENIALVEHARVQEPVL